MIKLTKIFGAAVLVVLLGACGSLVSFKNAKLLENDSTLALFGA